MIEGRDVTSIEICVFFPFLTEFGVHLAELTVDRAGALAIRQVSFKILNLCHPVPSEIDKSHVNLLTVFTNSMSKFDY